MSTRNTRTTWGLPARILHWAMSLMIFGLIAVGFYSAEVTQDLMLQFTLVQLHKSWGFTVFVLVLIRIVWRLMNPTPALPEAMPKRERLIAHGVQYLLYALMIIMPLSGWLMASASELQELYGIKNKVFGLFEMPDPFVPGSSALEEIFASIHFWCALLLTLVLLAHIAGAVKHHFVDRDPVLRRMIRGR
ncbi:MAG: cytochrome b [Pseudomonadota bacterium]